jgi:hypothetical protein
MAVRGKITIFAVGAVVATGFAPGTAGAQQGLTVDPQSPAGVEYAVPLDTARGHAGGHLGGGNGGGGAGGGGGSGTAGTGAPALFGSGITPPAKAASRSGSGGGHGSGAGKRQSGGRGSKSGARTATAGSPSPVTPVTASASYSSTAPVAGIVGGVLLLGGGFGLFLRLRGRRSASLR